MDLRSLSTFKAILSEGSFHKAALRQNCSQSTVTFHVRLLEGELGVQLFERIGRRMVLTQAGKEILPHIEAILDSAQRINDYRKSRNELCGELRIAVAESLLSYKIQSILKKFVEFAPKVKLLLQALNCHDIRDGILSGEIDLGVYYDVGGHPASLEVQRICSFEGAIVASPQLSLCQRDFDTPNQEIDVAFVINESRSIYREIMENYLRSKNIHLRNTIELWSIEAIKRCVSSNLGISFLPRFAVAQEIAAGMLIEIPAAIYSNSTTAVCVHHKNKVLDQSMAYFKRLVLETGAFQESTLAAHGSQQTS